MEENETDLKICKHYNKISLALDGLSYPVFKHKIFIIITYFFLLGLRFMFWSDIGDSELKGFLGGMAGVLCTGVILCH